jgi:hypothetical protein
MLGEELCLDASLARANAQLDQQPAPQLTEWPRDQPVGANRQNVRQERSPVFL